MGSTMKTEAAIGNSTVKKQPRQSHPQNRRLATFPRPISWPVIAAWLCITVFTAHSVTSIIGSGDTWMAMAAGRHISSHGVNTPDPFSYNSLPPGPSDREIEDWPSWAQNIAEKMPSETLRRWHPTGWINQNWLTHLFFYRLTTAIGSEEYPFMGALVYWKFLVYFLTAACIYAACRIMGGNIFFASLGTCLALFVSRTFLGMRPADFTNLLTAVYILVLLLTSYRGHKFIWLIVPLAVFWCNVHGGYIYLFITLVPFIGVNFCARPFQSYCKTLNLNGIYHTTGAGAAAFVSAVLFNPYLFSNFTHILEISIGPEAERWRVIDEWHPAFDFTNRLGNTRPFVYLLILAGVLAMAWFALRVPAVRHSERFTRKEDGKKRPTVSPAFWGIALLTVYMAIQSRRFIPMAAIVLCPLLMLLLRDIFNAHPSAKVKKIILIGSMAATAAFAVWTGIRFHRNYMAPWPYDLYHASVYTRLTGSYQMPYAATGFMRLNGMRGRIFNEWTEGGFLAWAQETGEKSGQPAMRVFIDGRAQAAYSIGVYDIYNYLWSGGEIGHKLATGSISPSLEVSQDMASWVSINLRANAIWAALVPRKYYSSNFYIALNYSPSWKVVFIDNNHTLFVDVEDVRGKRLFDGIGTGDSLYPDSFTRNLNQGHYNLVNGTSAEEQTRGLAQIIAAYNEFPSKAPLMDIIQTAALIPHLQPAVLEFSESRLKDFEQHKSEYEQQNGYALHLNAMKLLCGYARFTALGLDDTPSADEYEKKSAQYSQELLELGIARKW
ncbi:MAG: hypothetical protein B0D92_07190 [Spirochaeta sp. LUC14_002_19_P3]|nr:MAG: hypothetical protein B0D92_07190 [Spirochaeta sp. LUC14_002_19_P3]